MPSVETHGGSAAGSFVVPQVAKLIPRQGRGRGRRPVAGQALEKRDELRGLRVGEAEGSEDLVAGPASPIEEAHDVV